MKRRESLDKERTLSEIKQISSDLAAKTDLIKKLNESLILNKKKLAYTKEDYFYLNNKRNQILTTINNYKEIIQEFTKKKKDCFSQINTITREMSNATQKSAQDELNLDLPHKKSYSKAEAIKTLQRQAKEHQYEINRLNVKINESQLNLDQINPSFQTMEADYNSLLTIITNDETRINKLKSELKDTLNENEDWKEIDAPAYSTLKSKQDIENEIDDISHQLSILAHKTTHLDLEHPENLSTIIKELTEINESLSKTNKSISIPYENDEIIDCIENFRKVEILCGDLEDLINMFLRPINLEMKFQIAISDDFNNFSIITFFLRSNKENIQFEDLTTPEKIYFVMVFYISIKITLQIKNILFSNLFIPSEYNKRGSVYRTITKILPIFEQEKSLKTFNLIFLISNLEMKKKIENVKIIKIDEK